VRKSTACAVAAAREVQGVEDMIVLVLVGMEVKGRVNREMKE
jgi:hypothetical protein